MVDRFPGRSLKLMVFGILLILFGAVAPTVVVNLIWGTAIATSSPVIVGSITAAYLITLLQTVFILLGFLLGLIGVFVRD